LLLKNLWKAQMILQERDFVFFDLIFFQYRAYILT